MLSDTWTSETLDNTLLPRESWKPFPTAGDHDAWSVVPRELREAYLARATASLNHEWPALPATLFLDFARTGNRRNYERVSFGRRTTLADLVIAECLEGNGRFTDDIVNGIWAICEESFWGIPACMYMQKPGPGLPDIEEPVVPLFVGETIALLSWTVYLLEPQLNAVSPLIVDRIKAESKRRVLDPLIERDDFWWMGLGDNVHPITGKRRRVNNWNPWIISNWLTAALILEDTEADRIKHVAKAILSLDQFVDPYPEDGGCDEGPSYWGRAGASLFDCLEILYHATNGAIDVYDNPKIQEIGRFVYRAQIADRYFVNFADASALVLPSASITYLYGKRIGDENLMDIGAWSAQQRKEGENWSLDGIARALPAMFAYQEILDRPARQPLPRDVWLPEIQVIVARDIEGSPEGLFVTAKGGHNEESHNHNDVGTFSAYIDGLPLLVDAGVETYTAKTFSANRYDIWTMQTGYHNLPTFNGVQQEPGEEFHATDVSYSSDDTTVSFSANIEHTYPKGCGLQSWRRNVTMLRGDSIQIQDEYGFDSEPTDLQWHLMTPSDVSIPEAGWIHLTAASTVGDLVSGAGWIRFDPNTVDVSWEEIEINDERMSSSWGSRLKRINLTAKSPGAGGSFTISVTKER
jgi:hypothetical protein